jgi:uncharacterized membrane protein
MKALPLSSYLTVLFTAILPVWELKGAIPTGVMGMGMPLWMAFILAYLGSCIPSIFIIFFIEKIIKRLAKSKSRFLNKVANWILGKVEKHHDKIEKYGYLGIFIFVAIPLPGTGVWTGSLLAAMMGLQPKKAIPIVFLGNLVAGIAMVGITMLGGHMLDIGISMI